MLIDANGNVAIGTTTPSNAQGWARVFDVHGSSDSKAIATNDSGQRVGIYSHSSWLGGGGFVGTETNHTLHFITGYAPKMSLLTNGYLGIGVTAPVAKLHVSSTVERETLRVYKEGNSANYLSIWQGTGAAALDPIGTGKLYIGYDQTTDVYFNGNIGIGTTSPTQKLTVNGTIYGKEVKVDLNVPGPDYVFEKDYKLPSLEEIKSYIDQHKHLSEVPSAKQMAQNGINLSEMNMILLKKVEELTLIIINQNSQLQNLAKDVRSQQIEIEKLKKQ